MKQDNDDQNSNQPNEEKIKQIIKKGPFLYAYMLGVVLHREFSKHILILTITNFAVATILVGLTSRFYPIIGFQDVVSFIIFFILSTLVEIFIKLSLFLLIHRIQPYLLIVVFFLVNVSVFLLVDLMMPQVSFLFEATNILSFTVLFMLIRLLFTMYIRRAHWIQGGI
ncbi:Uncharacterised protein [Acholeplasma oculi]|uniref:Uncharacterized protein n=1 Tax=Acholeplasma oculi TaxID=35623 RepID=A0A061AF19_9MOLU|nr:hypothetical protein [Acholeplasma oculi]CDR30121.1 hypothetical protein Aocu_00480 [Acholeplasma oculi]SKC44678.1 hypothetical protein SAMN02745122_1125 [Acholeplasma oculi]SUT88421.1 Uncharacterised protein [Acholeplasma oculi]